MGTTDEAIKYLERGYYLGYTGYLCKVGVVKKLRLRCGSQIFRAKIHVLSQIWKEKVHQHFLARVEK